jgi:cysteine-rich repeat protein
MRAVPVVVVMLASCARSGLELVEKDRGASATGGSGATGGVGATGGSGGASAGTAPGGTGGVGGTGPGTCGDSVVDTGETCDEGDRTPGDGCSERCRAEPVMLAAGSNFNCALSSAGVVKCWGENGSGQLGVGDAENRGDEPSEMGERLPAVDFGSERRATELACGYLHCCAILEGGSLKCWGANQEGQLGLGDRRTRGRQPAEMGDALPPVELGTGRHAVAVAAGGRHSCVILDDGSVKCWGENLLGELGLGDSLPHGTEPEQMGDALAEVKLGTARRALELSAGASHTCVVLDDGALKCWGINARGQLGLGDAELRGDQAGEMGSALPAVALAVPESPAQLAAGNAHTCASFAAGALFCWGFASSGQLGLGDAVTRGDQSDEMGARLPPVDLAGAAVTSVAAGYTHTCALLRSGDIRCWGGSFWGELGLGDRRARGDETGEMGTNLASVPLGALARARSVVTNEQHSCALLDDGSVKCWGYNAGGRLGLGDTEHRGDEPGEMGDALPALELGF